MTREYVATISNIRAYMDTYYSRLQHSCNTTNTTVKGVVDKEDTFRLDGFFIPYACIGSLHNTTLYSLDNYRCEC